MVEDNLKPIMKPQVEIMHKNRNSFQVSVGQLLDRKDERGMKDQLCNGLQLNEVIDRKVAKLSGGELQRVGIAAAALQSADVYMFDEPSSYLDVKQRLNAARVIKSLLRTNSYVIVVEHDLSVLDYMSDYICCLYG
jgi:ATP-binding cassette subfamily E protein 1